MRKLTAIFLSDISLEQLFKWIIEAVTVYISNISVCAPSSPSSSKKYILFYQTGTYRGSFSSNSYSSNSLLLERFGYKIGEKIGIGSYSTVRVDIF